MMEPARDGIVSPPSVDYGDGDEEIPSAAEGPLAETLGNDAPAPVEPEKEPQAETMRPRMVEVALKNSRNFED